MASIEQVWLDFQEAKKKSDELSLQAVNYMHLREKATNYKEYLTYNLLWETTLKECHEYVERKEQLFLKLSALSREEEQEEHPRREIVSDTAAKSEPAAELQGRHVSHAPI